MVGYARTNRIATQMMRPVHLAEFSVPCRNLRKVSDEIRIDCTSDCVRDTIVARRSRVVNTCDVLPCRQMPTIDSIGSRRLSCSNGDRAATGAGGGGVALTEWLLIVSRPTSTPQAAVSAEATPRERWRRCAENVPRLSCAADQSRPSGRD